MLLDAAADDIPEPDSVRRLMRDLREVRMAKLRAGVRVLDGGREVKMNGVGGMEIAEGRAFIVGVVDGLRYALNGAAGCVHRWMLVWFGADARDFVAEKSVRPRSFPGRREKPMRERMVLEGRVMMTMIWIYKSPTTRQVHLDRACCPRSEFGMKVHVEYLIGA